MGTASSDWLSMKTPVNSPGAFPLPEWEKSLEAIGVLGGTSKVCGEECREECTAVQMIE
jgi:hypothetical protein